MSTVFFIKKDIVSQFSKEISVGVLVGYFLTTRSYSQIQLNFPETFIPARWDIIQENSPELVLVGLGLLLASLIAVLATFVFLKIANKFNRKVTQADVKEMFFENAVQEMRSAMNGLVGIVRLLSATRIMPEQKECVDLLKYSSERSLSLLNNIWNFSKIESGKMDMECISFDLYSTVRRVVLLHMLEAREKGIALHYYYESDVQKYFIGDPNRIQLVIGNLIDNAIKFTQKGSVSVEIVDHSSPEDPHGEISIFVRDTGVGMPVELQRVVFNKFFKYEYATFMKSSGCGIGLFVAQTLVRMMGGALEVKSDGRSGTEIICRLSLKKDFSSHLVPETISGIHIGCPFEKEFYPVKAGYYVKEKGSCEEPLLHQHDNEGNASLTDSFSFQAGHESQRGGLHMETLLLSLLKGCPWGDEKKNCPLCELRRLPTDQGKLRILQMSRAEKMKICEAHQLCVSRR